MSIAGASAPLSAAQSLDSASSRAFARRTAGMLTSAIILLPVAAAQGIHPWICIFCTAIFSDISFFRHQGTNGILQIQSAGLFETADERGFMRYNLFMNAARVAAVYASIPWWKWLGLL
jgi:hypothetical protein